MPNPALAQVLGEDEDFDGQVPFKKWIAHYRGTRPDAASNRRSPLLVNEVMGKLSPRVKGCLDSVKK